MANRLLPDKLPETPWELADYIVRYAGSIYVRHQKNGEWGNYSLAELDPVTAMKTAMNFLISGIVPVRLLSEEEIKTNLESK